MPFGSFPPREHYSLQTPAAPWLSVSAVSTSLPALPPPTVPPPERRPLSFRSRMPCKRQGTCVGRCVGNHSSMLTSLLLFLCVPGRWSKGERCSAPKPRRRRSEDETAHPRVVPRRREPENNYFLSCAKSPTRVSALLLLLLPNIKKLLPWHYCGLSTLRRCRLP